MQSQHGGNSRKSQMMNVVAVALVAVAALTAWSVVGVGPAAAGAADYAEHAPIACVGGALVTEHEGLAYDPSGVTGTGTASDPYVVDAMKISTSAYAQYPQVVLVDNCPHFHVVNSQVYGTIGRDPACGGPNGIQPGEFADFGIRAVNSTDVVVDNSIVKFTREAGVLVDGGSATVKRSDLKVNWGTGVLATGGADVNLSDSYVAYNGWFHRRYAASVYAEDGASVHGSNNTVTAGNNGLVVDKSTNAGTDVAITGSDISNHSWRYTFVIAFGDTWSIIDCGDTSPPNWWYSIGLGANGPDAFGAAERYPAAVPESGGDDPAAALVRALGLDAPDRMADPQNVVDVRLNYWGAIGGPSGGGGWIVGKADYRFWLPQAPPGTLVNGALRANNLYHPVMTEVVKVERLVGGLAEVEEGARPADVAPASAGVDAVSDLTVAPAAVAGLAIGELAVHGEVEESPAVDAAEGEPGLLAVCMI